MSGRGGGADKKHHSSQSLESKAKDRQTVDVADPWTTVATSGKGRPNVGQPFTQNRFGLFDEPSSYPDKSMRSSSIASSTGRSRG